MRVAGRLDKLQGVMLRERFHPERMVLEQKVRFAVFLLQAACTTSPVHSLLLRTEGPQQGQLGCLERELENILATIG